MKVAEPSIRNKYDIRNFLHKAVVVEDSGNLYNFYTVSKFKIQSKPETRKDTYAVSEFKVINAENASFAVLTISYLFSEGYRKNRLSASQLAGHE